MEHRHIETIGHYVLWGAIYGLVLGGLCGTLILPIFGMVYSVPWGLGIGLTLGVIVGVVMAIINAIAYRTPNDLINYRRRFTLTVGLFVAIGAPFLLTITTHGILWGQYTEGFFPYFLPSLLGSIFWGSLSSAYVTSWYADWYAGMIHKQKNDMDVDDALTQKYGIMRHFFAKLFRRDWKLTIIILFTALGYFLFIYPRPPWSYSYYHLGYFGMDLGFVVLGILATGIVVVLTSGYLTVFVMRVFLLEYGWSFSPTKLQRTVRIIVCGFFALVVVVFALKFDLRSIYQIQLAAYCMWAVLGIYSGWRMTDGFGEWYFREEKVKSKPKMEVVGA